MAEVEEIVADRVEDGKMIINDPNATPEKAEAIDETPVETPDAIDEAPEKVETPVEDTTEPKEEAPEMVDKGGFVKKSEIKTPTKQTPEWFKEFNEAVSGDFTDIEALKKRLAAEKEVVHADFKDDYIKDATKYYNEHGTLQPYLDAFSVNFKEMSPENLMRRKIEQEYPSMSKQGIDKLYQRDVVDKYNLDGEEHDEDTVKFGKELLASDSEKLRDQFIKTQEAFVPPPQEDVQAKVEAQLNEWRESVNQNPFASTFKDEGLININVEGEDYAYQVENPNEIVEMAIDNRNFWELFSDGKGGINMEAFIEVASFAKNREQYRSSLINLGKSSGIKTVKTEVKNGKKPSIKTQKPDGYNDWSEGFLAAALNQKKN